MIRSAFKLIAHLPQPEIERRVDAMEAKALQQRSNSARMGDVLFRVHR